MGIFTNFATHMCSVQHLSYEANAHTQVCMTNEILFDSGKDGTTKLKHNKKKII